MNMRRFDDKGIDQFTDFLTSLNSAAPIPYPEALLTDPDVTEIISPAIEVSLRSFDNRYTAAEYFYSLFSNSYLSDIEYDRGIWAWLSLFFFEVLCPADAKGRRKPGQIARWIPESGVSWRYYRHLLAGPYRIYLKHKDDPSRAMIVLCGPLHQPGDIVEQLASRQELITNPGIIEAATRLFYDPSFNKPKRGAASKSGKGTVRRFADILSQFDVTWDLYSLDADDVLNMLPAEFSKFRD